MAVTHSEVAGQTGAPAETVAPAVVSGLIGGSLATLCWSVGLTAVAAWAVGLNTLFFALDKISPVGSRPILVLTGLLLTVVLTWLLTAPQRQHLPAAIARRALRQSMASALFAGAATYFVLMQIIMPLLFTVGVPMGALFPR